MLKILKKSISFFFVLIVFSCFSFAVSVNAANTSSVNGKCNTAYAKKVITYKEFNSEWMNKKASSFCLSGSPYLQSVSCASYSKSAERCYYTCNGKNGGVKTSCVFFLKKESLCGDSISKSFSSSPQQNLCVTNSIASTVESRFDTWNWTCKSYNGLLTSYCSAPKSCFKSGEFVSGSQQCCSGLLFCASNSSSSSPGYCSEKCTGDCLTYDPVCGKDGKDYNNECSATRAGIVVAFEGECRYQGAKCGVASEKTGYSLEDSNNLCTYGEASIVTGTGPWSWICQKENGYAVLCSSIKQGAINGSCGDNHGKTLKQIPSTGLCRTGTASAVSGDIAWYWNCSGLGGKKEYCYAEREGYKVNGVCGSPVRISSGFISENEVCSSGFPSEIVFSNDQWKWTCKGFGGGSNAECSASYIFNSFVEKFESGTCGSINGTSLGEEPKKEFCLKGLLRDFYWDNSSGQWRWICEGKGGGSSENCRAYYSSALIKANGQCGNASLQPTETIPTTDLCLKGNASAITGTGPWSWTCQGISGGNDEKCKAKKPVAINGSCGDASRKALSSKPIDALCSKGNASSVTGTGPWYWTCIGSYGGTNIECSTKISNELTPGSETENYLLVDLWTGKNQEKGIRISVKDSGVKVYINKSSPPYKSKITPDNPNDFQLEKINPPVGWTTAYFYSLPEGNKTNVFCADAWYSLDWSNGKLSNLSQFYSDCITLSPTKIEPPEDLEVKLYPILSGAIVFATWTDNEKVGEEGNNYETIIVRTKGVLPVKPDKETTINQSVLGTCNGSACPSYELLVSRDTKKFVSYLTKGKYCYSSWTRNCQGYFCNNSENTSFWCFEIK